ncbi:MAG: NADP-dependent oxidoreductase [Betaproteobacteria bacterium]|nr:NADP-dependent oxidoreductase [Betaproteobacteria bacterium]
MATMKAVRIHEYGGPDVMRIEDVPIPALIAGRVLVQVHVAAVNPVDWKIREGYLGRDRSMPLVLGGDFAGRVVAAGHGVSDYQQGNAVFGHCSEGAYAEYLLAAPKAIAHKPNGLNMINAACLPVAGLTAWQALFDTADLKAGQTVLVHGGAGGVGHFAIQLAKWKGATVWATASAPQHPFLRRLGADRVMDYRTQRFEDLGRADVVLDTIGGETQTRSWAALVPGGMLVSLVEPPVQELAQAAKARGKMIFRHDDPEALAELGRLAARGEIHVHVGKVLPLSEARQALEWSQSRHATGKIVLQLTED